MVLFTKQTLLRATKNKKKRILFCLYCESVLETNIVKMVDLERPFFIIIIFFFFIAVIFSVAGIYIETFPPKKNKAIN